MTDRDFRILKTVFVTAMVVALVCVPLTTALGLSCALDADCVAVHGGPDPEMRFFTLEDLFGDTGNTFQASIGFINFEGTPTNQAQQSYGLAIDDMVVKWREVSLEEDETDCAVSGSCATIELATSNVFEGQTVLTVTVM